MQKRYIIIAFVVLFGAIAWIAVKAASGNTGTPIPASDTDLAPQPAQ